VASHIATFLAGVFIGAAGEYFALKYTDRRRAKEYTADSRKQFCNVASKMSELIKEIQVDLRKPGYSMVREFFILPGKGVVLNAPGKHLEYYEDEHEDLPHKVTLLENHSYVTDVTCTNVPKYRMSEEFVDLLLQAKIRRGVVRL
jgi:hypothetical protein